MKRIAETIVKLRTLFLTIWVVAFVLLGYFALDLPSLLQGDGFRTDGEYEQVQEILTEDFDRPESTILVLFESADEEKIEETLSDIESLDIATSIQSPLEMDSMYKEDTAYAAVHFDQESTELKGEIEEIRNITKETDGVTLTGEPVITEDINKASQEDLKNAELIGLPFALVILLLAFGTITASLLPLIIGGFTVVAGFGFLAIAGDSISLSVFILNIAPMIGLALSIDFALLFINRYREELTKQSIDDALATTIQTAGRSIIFSAVCVFIGLGAMSIIDVDIFLNIALGGTVVITLAVLTSLTLLPAMLRLLGPRINKFRVLPAEKDTIPKWRAFAKGIMKRPVMTAVLSFVILAIGIIPVTNMNVSIPTIDALPESYDSRSAYETIEETFLSDSESTIYAVTEQDIDWLSEEGLEEMKAHVEDYSSPDIVDSVDSLYSAADVETAEELYGALQNPQTKEALQPAIDQFIADDKLLLPANLTVAGNSDEAQELAREWKEEEALIGGQPAFNQEIYDEIFDKLPAVLTIIIVSTFFILMLAFRSILIPIKAILMNILGLASTFGILVWLFQGGHLGLNEADIALILPVIVFSLVFGLSMDYEVFLISRIREFYLESGDNEFSTVEGVANTSKIITSAALIMIVITGAFAFTGVVPVKQIGIGIAIAIFIDATIIRLLLVPSLMKLFGGWNWWFPFSRNK
ncbi:MMPL family transporter [Salimicrobium halophilum]|uniref:Putative drug exporter of the RND superfamily n=1 Tax=Salimicrobium halophilum TaxID=86666 RepID=A0A1G8VUB6_9BACI|nr:MMPL family transporter [Salimicrobium halophilum]SDJ68800.1 putative drug exporter of the RND superfamily [Salimicrobium halophilum]